MNKYVLLFLVAISTTLAFGQGATQRIALINLQQSNVVESSRAGQIGLTDANGNQRYAQYTEIDLVPITYTPTATGNTQNYSEFVTTSTGDIWYIDWQGRGLKIYAAASAGDYDWLEISNNQIPNSIRDSIYTDNYAAVNLRYVWPNAQFLAGDSTSINGGNIVVLGNREGRIGFYRLTGPAWSSMGQEGANLTARLGTGTTGFIVQSAAGVSSSQPAGPYRDIMQVSKDSTVRFHDYPRTRNDTNAIVNFLYTDGIGVLRSSPVTELPGGGGGGGMDSVVTTIRLTGKGTVTNPLDISPRYTAAGALIEFNERRTYGTEAAPVTGNITISVADANIDEQYVIHRSSTPPTFPSSFLVSGLYQVSVTNFIRIRYFSPTTIQVHINE